MEPEVHIIEKYFQEILHCFTMTNIRCKGSKEIDLLAINPKTLEKYHVEARIGTSPSFKIREKDTHTSNGRAHKIGLDYFQKEKFEHEYVKAKIHEIFGDSDYHKVLVVWSTQDNIELPKIAKKQYGIEIMILRGIIHKFMNNQVTSGSRDDILRTMELVAIVEHRKKIFRKKLYRLRAVEHENKT